MAKTAVCAITVREVKRVFMSVSFRWGGCAPPVGGSAGRMPTFSGCFCSLHALICIKPPGRVGALPGGAGAPCEGRDRRCPNIPA
jgi:hypothetical protein